MQEVAVDTLREASKGDDSAFRRLYEHYAPVVWRQVVRMAQGDEELAAQITQDVFVRVHAGLRRFDGRSAFSTWLFRIAYNRAMTVLTRRQRQRRRTVPLHDEIPGREDTGRLEAREIVQRLLAPLSPDERFLLVAREVDGVPFEELATITGRKPGALRTQLSRLKRALREGGDDVGE
ncbi:MAG: sigma-70 family RNA polymerase sigma factor [Chitinivibrionales bacterium]|nr:sigma-70 family RNA polymerase sigma factor [Chitinivibrionales bacterium]